ncbi:MAG: sodium:proton antiporter [Rhodospirillales bacterium]
MKRLAIAAIGLMLCGPAWAAEAGHASIDGTKLGIYWVLPFAGLLLSIAIMPLAVPKFWHHHFGKVAAFWALCFLIPNAALFGLDITGTEVLHTALLEYIPFIILLLALFTVAGGVVIGGNLHGSPSLNTAMLTLGTLLAGIMGTTGASILLIRPLLRANDNRKHKTHVFIFFIFLVSNIGGALTPLGDPPLFLGFLKGVDFFWPAIHISIEMLLAVIVLLSLFFAIDSHYYGKEGEVKRDPTPDSPILLHGGVNIILLLCVVGAVLMSGIWKTDAAITVAGIELGLPGLLRDVLLLAITFASWRLTSQKARKANEFSWGPMLEVAKLFAGIFVTIIPAIAILRTGANGALAPLVGLVTGPNGEPINAWYFWLTGGLSSFLDNAPTYLIFFNMAGGDAGNLMGPLAATLSAISAGAVFMGANSYIGNAPNFMVKSIVEERGVKMPSFFGYMAWSCGILLPLFVVLTLLFYR